MSICRKNYNFSIIYISLVPVAVLVEVGHDVFLLTVMSILSRHQIGKGNISILVPSLTHLLQKTMQFDNCILPLISRQ